MWMQNSKYIAAYLIEMLTSKHKGRDWFGKNTENVSWWEFILVYHNPDTLKYVKDESDKSQRSY